MNTINRSNNIPLYLQLATLLKSEIVSGLTSHKYSTGDRIPSERELMKKYKLSRNTVRRAIDELIRENVIYAEQGHGNRIVSANLVINSRIDTFCEHHKLLEKAGYQPSCKMIETGVIQPQLSIRSKLLLDEHDEVQFIKKVFYADENPAILCIDFVPIKNKFGSLDGIEHQGHDFFNFLKEIGRQPIEFILADIYPYLADEEISKLLHCSKGTPLILLHELMLDPTQNKPVIFAHNYYLPEFIRFSILRRHKP